MIRSERGMTIFEILVAVFIITIGLVAVATGMQLATAGVATGQQQTTAAFLAEERLEDVKAFALGTAAAGQGWANLTAASFPDQAYDTIPNYSRYRRTTLITNSTVTTKRIDVSVFWVPVGVASGNSERSVTFSVVLTSRE